MKEIQIQLTKCLLILYENEIWQLPTDILKKAIGRGKGYKRCQRVEHYEKKTGDI